MMMPVNETEMPESKNAVGWCPLMLLRRRDRIYIGKAPAFRFFFDFLLFRS
jgi:hypothetical protein